MRILFPAFLLFALMIAVSDAAGQDKSNYQLTGDSLYKEKNYKGAIENYNKAIETSKENKTKLAVLLDKRAQVEIDQNEYKKAIEDESAAVLLDSSLYNNYWNRGIAYENIGDYQLAISDYNKAIELSQNNKGNLSILYDNIGVDECHQKNYKKAIESHSQAILYNSKNGDAYWHRALAYNLNGDYQLAINDYSTAMFYNFDPEDLATLYDNRGNNKRQLKQNREAISDYNTAIKLNPKKGKYFGHRGLAYQNNSDYQLAIDDFGTAILYFQQPKIDLAILYNYLAINKMALHKPDKALFDVTKAIELNQNNGYFYFTRGNIYSQMGKSKEAINDFTKAMDFYKGNPKIQAILHSSNATNLYIINENQKVIDECTIAIALDPNSSNSYFTRGKVYLKRIVNKDKALKDFNKVIGLDTSKSTVSYIFSQFYIGNTDVAMQCLQQQVLKTSSIDDVLNHYYNIACMFSIMNKPTESIVYLRKAIESGYSKEFAANDEDFDNIRKMPDYIALMGKGM